MALRTQDFLGPMIIYLTHADTDLLTLSHVVRQLPDGFPRIQALNPKELKTTEAVDRYLSIHFPQAQLVILRLLGGKRSFEEGFEKIVRVCKENNIPLIACSGDQQLDPELTAFSTVPKNLVYQTFQYLLQGGVDNLKNWLLFLSDEILHTTYGYQNPQFVPWDGLYYPQKDDRGEGKGKGRDSLAPFAPSFFEDIESFRLKYHQPGRPTVGILFYRVHWMSRNLDFIDALIHRLEPEANVLPVFCYSLKDEDADGIPKIFHRYLLDEKGQSRVDCLISTLSFSTLSHPLQQTVDQGPWTRLNVPILQAIVCTTSFKEWSESAMGLSPLDVAMNVALPEFDGRIISVPISFKEETVQDEVLGTRLLKYVHRPDRVDYLARLALNWARLRHKPNSEKRVAILLTNYPSKNARIGNAVGLDTPASVVSLLRKMKEEGYKIGEIPPDGDTLIHQIIARCSNDREFLTEEQMRNAVGHLEETKYRKIYEGLPVKVQEELRRNWGEPPGEVFYYNHNLVIPGIQLENIFIGLQPPRGYGDNPLAIYHSPDLVPTHHYLAYYRWLRDVFQADAILHVGKHGTLEWLPGKGIGLSESCYPEVVLSDLPNFYPYIINNPGEGTQAKRRSHATIIDHLIPAMTHADAYGDIARLEQLLDEYYRTQALDPKKLPILQQQIWQVVLDAKLHRDLNTEERPEDFDQFLKDVDGYICELKDAQIRSGLHILGQLPQGEELIGLLLAMTRLDNANIPSLRRVIAEALLPIAADDSGGTAVGGRRPMDYAGLLEHRGEPFTLPIPEKLVTLNPLAPIRTCGDILERLDAVASLLLQQLQARHFSPEAVEEVVKEFFGRSESKICQVLNYVTGFIYPNLERVTDEITHILRGLRGEYVPAGPSGSPTRGMASVLPTGRNFYSLDPRTIPSPAAWEVGKQVAEALLAKYLAEEGKYPETVGLVVWGTSAMRTHGDDIAEILYLLGVRPVWQPESRRVSRLEVIPLEELKRPRIDVTIRISGFFRDAFPNLIHLLDEAIEIVAGLDESPEVNYVIKHVQEDLARPSHSHTPTLPHSPFLRQQALYRIFGSKPGSYGAGILPALEERNWKTDQDLADIYIAWGSYAYTRTQDGVAAPEAFKIRFRQITIAAKNQDNREHDIFDSDDYMQYHGGMIATVRALTGKNPRQFFGDTSDPQRIKVRDLKEEALRVFRTRVINPKWIASIQRHGYKGASELAATVDYLFGYDATAEILEDWMYERLAETYILDESMQQFFQEKNPWALRDMTGRLLEAIERGLWEKPKDIMISQLRQVYLKFEGEIEQRTVLNPE
ncbi:MAG TPA: cobaltochelatase subunit CobN [Candidatus Limnocylindrales bacterium]|nr:cobaltochelatase subunit CobN [Candidatus Limnocylindrales bacterium]